MSDDRESQYRRAKEVLSGAGWVFDQYRAAQMVVLLSDQPLEEREQAHHRARASMEMQGALQSIVEGYEYELKQAEKKQKEQERRNARVRRAV